MTHPVKKHSGIATRRGLRRLATTVAEHWFVVLASHTSAVLLLMVVDRFVHAASCGR